MLKNKLFLLIFSLISITLIITGYISYKNMNDAFNIQVQKDINSDKVLLNNFINETRVNLLSLTDEVSKNEDLKSSLNLISLYQNPKEYIKEIFDFEKNNLIELSNKWIKDSAHYAMALFDKDMNLIMINRKLDENEALGYVTYNTKGEKEFLDFKTKETIKTPFIEDIKVENLEKYRLNFFIERFLFSYMKPVKLDGQIIGYIKLTTCLDDDVLKLLNKNLNQTTILFDSNGNYIFPSKKLQTKYEDFKNSKNILFVESELINLNNNLYSLSLIDRTIISQKVKDVLVSILEVWVLLLVFILIVSKLFVDKLILKPIDTLKQTILDIKKGKVLKKDHNESKDEIVQIVQEFKDLSVGLSKNIAFLESYEKAMDESSIVTKSDLAGNITYVNDNFCQITGFTKDEALGRPHNIVRHKSNSKEIFKEIWQTIRAKKVWKGILLNKGKLEDYWVDMAIVPILDENKEIVEYIAIRHDITKVIKQQEELDNLANTDSLTGLGNRYKLTNDIRNSINPALAILNIDNFSQINDFYGHEIGDNLIKQVGLEISNHIQNDSFSIYHLQGDEYVIFNQNIDKEEFLLNIEKLIESVKKTIIKVDEEELNFNFSTAVSFESKEKILSTADMALKVAKRDNKYLIIYNDDISLNNEYENNIKWTKKIKDSLNNDNFIPVFQPIVNNKNEKWEKYESLVRMEDDDKLISPYFFLDISKKTKHYTQITKMMIKKSFDTFKDKDVEFSINLTVEDILDSDIKKYILTMLQEYQIGQRVVFEIVESESIENFEQIQKFINDVKSLNCKIAIDDFGTGYSNFEYLVQLRADYIKIDGSLIKDIDTNKTSQIVVKNIINFANDLGMKTIAEFVENESICNKVKEMGIDYSQGYYFSAPNKSLKI